MMFTYRHCWRSVVLAGGVLFLVSTAFASLAGEEKTSEEGRQVLKTLSTKYNGTHVVELVVGIRLKPDVLSIANGFLTMAFKGNGSKNGKDFEEAVVLPLNEIKSMDGKAVDQFYANFALGNFWLYKQKDYRKAAGYYANAAAIKFDGESAVLVNLGNCYNAIRYYRESVALGERAVKVFPRDEKLWCNLGVAYLGIQDLEKAQGAFNNIFSSDGESESAGIAHANLGSAYYQQQLNTKARMHLEKAVEILGNFERQAEVVKNIQKLLKRYDKILPTKDEQ